MYLWNTIAIAIVPSYANLYLGAWERMVFSEDRYISYLDHILCWYRFIDDLFLIWTGSKDLLVKFTWQLNINDLNLYFTFNLDPKHIPFLDLMIIKHIDGTIATYLYHKYTAGNPLLHASSVHPRPLVHSIPYVQFLRLHRGRRFSFTS